MSYLGADTIGNELLLKPVDLWSKENCQHWMEIQGVENLTTDNKFNLNGLMCLQIANSEAYMIRLKSLMVFPGNDPLAAVAFEIAMKELHRLYKHQKQLQLLHGNTFAQLNIQDMAVGADVVPVFHPKQPEAKRSIQCLDDLVITETPIHRVMETPTHHVMETPTHYATVEEESNNAVGRREHEASPTYKPKIRRLSSDTTKRAIGAASTVVATTRSSSSSA